MAILNIVTSQVGQVGQVPKWIYIATNSTLAQVTTAGFLNQAVQNGATFSESDMALVSTKTSPSAVSTQVAILEISYSPSTGWSLVSTGGPGSVTLPTIANHIATYTNTLGALSEDPTTAISGGNIQAGLSGTAGYLASFPSAASKGSLRLTAVANTGDTLTTISNAAMGQASVISIPDPGAATANFLISTTAAGQTIAGGLTLSTGNLVVSAGNVTAGSAASAGTVTSFSGSGASEFLRLQAVNNTGGDFSTTISNATSVGQSQVLSIPDCGGAAANFLVSTTTGTQHITVGSLQVDAGQVTSGLTSGGVTGGFRAYSSTASNGSLVLSPIAAGGNFDTVISNSAMTQTTVYSIPDIGAATGGFTMGVNPYITKVVRALGLGGGSPSFTVTDAFCTTSDATVIAQFRSQANPASILKVVGGVGEFTVTASADPGISELDYIIYRG